MTHANCSTRHFGEVVDAWPIGIGHPCVGCTEQESPSASRSSRHRRDRAADAARHLSADPSPSTAGQPGGHRRGGRRRRRAVGAGFVGLEEAGRRPTRRPDTEGGVADGHRSTHRFSKDRRCGRRRMTAVPATAPARERRKAPADAVGLLYDATLCIGCKACVVACKRGQRPAGRQHRVGGGLYDAPRRSERAHQDGHQAVRRRRRRPSFVKEQCMHCVDPACVSACMLGALKKREFGIVTYDAEPLHRLPLLRGGLPVQRAEVRVDARRRRRSSSASSARTGWPQGKQPACTEVCPRQAVIFGKRDRSARRSAPAHLPRTRAATCQKVYGETDAGGTQVLYLSHVAVREARLPLRSDEPAPQLAADRPARRLSRASSRPVALYALLGAVMFRNRGSRSRGRVRRDSMRTAQPVGGRSAHPPLRSRSRRLRRARRSLLIALAPRRRPRRHHRAQRRLSAGASGSPSTSSPARRSPAAATPSRSWSTSSTRASTTRWSGRRC